MSHYKLKIPARVNVLGNPADANEGDFATISMAVDIFAGAEIEACETVRLAKAQSEDDRLPACVSEFNSGEIEFLCDPDLLLVKAAICVLHRYSEEFRAKYAQRGFSIRLWSDVPRQSGLGGSSLFVLLTLGALRAFYELDPYQHNDYVLSELTQHAEADECGIACGFADRIVPLFGGIAYTDYRGKLLPNPVDEEPYTTYERLDEWVESFPLVLISTGVQRDSGDVHGRMRPKYIEEYQAWLKRGGEYPPMMDWMSGAYETAWRGKIALLKRDWKTFGALMNRNHQLVDAMMSYCGFENGAGWANNLCIQAALENGALGAKLTGAGGGGSVFALTMPGEEEQLMEVWRRTARENGLDHAHVYQVNVARPGLRIERI